MDEYLRVLESASGHTDIPHYDVLDARMGLKYVATRASNHWFRVVNARKFQIACLRHGVTHSMLNIDGPVIDDTPF